MHGIVGAMSWSDRTIAKIWRKAGGGQPEGCLEYALLSVLETPGGWHLIRERLGVGGLPADVPYVVRQTTRGDSRSDITLKWSSRARPLVLELKVWEPPSGSQVDKYLRQGCDVVSVAAFPGRTKPRRLGQATYFGVVSWRGVVARAESEPLVLAQLRGLAEEVGVSGRPITKQGLVGMVDSWGVWEAMEPILWGGTKRAQSLLHGADPYWRHKRSRKPKVSRAWGRFQFWLWNVPGEAGTVEAWAYCGLQMTETLATGPDLVFAIQVDPGHRCRTNVGLLEAVQAWRAGEPAAGGARRRQADISAQSWVLVESRRPAVAALAEVEDPGAGFVAWVEEEVNALIADDVVVRLAAALQPNGGDALANG